MTMPNYREQAKRDLDAWFKEHVTPLLEQLPDGTVLRIGDGVPVLICTCKHPERHRDPKDYQDPALEEQNDE